MLEAFFVAIFFSSLALIKSYKRVACAFNWYDIPNERSSHTRPIPLGAGLTFALTLTFAITALALSGRVYSDSFFILAAGAFLCTLLGFVDDINNLSPKFRLFVQFAISIATMFYLTDFLAVPFDVRFLPFDIAFVSFTFGVLYVMWMVNLFNFMDGLDGLLSSQVFIYGIASYFLCHISGNSDLGIIYLVLSTLTLPFLFFNWRPAKIFMGDAGAYFFGFSFAFLGLVGKIEYEQSLVAQVILMGALVSDATYTLIMRIVKHGKCVGAHREHLFQKLSDKTKFRTSRIVTSYLLLSTFILFPLSLLSINNSNLAVELCFLSYLLLLLIYFGVLKVITKMILPRKSGQSLQATIVMYSSYSTGLI